MYESDDKMVSHPSHYQSKTGLEVIDVIEAFTHDLQGIEAIDTGNVIKYICRWKKKNGIQDLKKAMWYLQNLIDHLEATKKEENASYDFVRCGYCGEVISFNDCKTEQQKTFAMCDHLLREHGVVIRTDISFNEIVKNFTKEN